jgi:exosortase A-associated hydrolase 2
MLKAEVIRGRSGQLLVVVHAARGDAERRTVIVAPPFGEEMNKSRRMLSLFAQAAAECGIGTALPDLTGTGDSDGEFADARWDIWCDDLARTMDSVEARTGRAPVLLAVRTGALLAFDVLRSFSLRCAELVLWAPVLDGERFMRQFLRLRIAGTMAQSLPAQADRESVASLEVSLRAGTALEVGGYTLAPELWAAMSKLKAHAPPPESGTALHWFELVAAEPCQMPPAAQRCIDALNRAGWRVQGHALAGPAFWGTAEITEVPQLVSATVSALNPHR